MFQFLRNEMFAGLFSLALALVGGLAVQAGDYHQPPACRYKQVTTYECRIVYETRTQSYQKVVVCYDACGKPYETVKTCYREVQVPVKKIVPVTKTVLVCE